MKRNLQSTFKAGLLTHEWLSQKNRQGVFELLEVSHLKGKTIVLDMADMGKEVIDAFITHPTFKRVLMISTPVLKNYWEAKLRQFSVDGWVYTLDNLLEKEAALQPLETIQWVCIDDLHPLQEEGFDRLTTFWTHFSTAEFVLVGVGNEDRSGIAFDASKNLMFGKQEGMDTGLKAESAAGHMVISVKLMGKPAVIFNEQPVYFKYQKAEAIFYFLSVYQKVDRSRIMSIFWPDQAEEKARKNLRNALYSIRQAFKTDVLTTLGQRNIGFSEAISLETDWQCVSDELSEGQSCSFLDSFSVKDTVEFDLWVEQMREELQGIRLERLRVLLKEALKTKGDVEGLAKAIIKLEPYDEETCRVLMRYYIETSQQGKCLEVYSRLSRILEEELALKPELETEQLLKQGIEGRKIQIVQGRRRPDFFYGRQAELERIEAFLASKKAEGATGLILVTGEAGIGKSSLIRTVLEQVALQENFRIRIACNEGDEHHFMKSWYPIILKIGEVLLQRNLSIGSHQRDALSRVFPTFMNTAVSGMIHPMEKQELMPLVVIIRLVMEVLLNLADSVAIVLTIEDLQWMDPWGLELLKALAVETKTEKLVLIASYRKATNKALKGFESEVVRNNRALTVHLERFTAGDTEGFIDEYPGRPQLDSVMRQAIFKESDGNALILTEILKDVVENGSYQLIPSRVKTLFSGRYTGLSVQARKLVDLMSAFFEPSKWDEIRHLSLLTEVELLETIEELMATEFVKELEIQDEVAYSFSHYKLKEYIYNQQSATKRRLLHKRIGDYYREHLTGGLKDRLLYPRLVQHFERSGDKKAHLEFRIRSIYDYLEMSHELFPMIKYRHLFDPMSVYQITDEFVVREIATIGKLMETIVKDETTVKLELEYLNMIGRYEVVQGDVTAGCAYLEKMIHWAEREKYSEFIVKGYLQLIFNAINQRNISEMEAHIQSAFKWVKENTNKGEIGVVIRLKGYLMILKNKYIQGETLLLSAARIFERPENQEIYGLNRVATIYYLGESRRLQNDYTGALKWYREAETLCNVLGFTGHLALILSAMGIAAYDSGRFTEADERLQQAVKLYDSLHFKWGQISAYAYWSLVNLRNGNFIGCLLYLKKADRLTQAFDHVYERGLMLRIKAEVCCLLKTMGKDESLVQYLHLPHTSYCQEAFQFFETHTNFTYEEKVLADLKKVCGQCALYQ